MTRPTPNRLRAIPPIARCACGEIVIARGRDPHEAVWCADCRGFVDAVVSAANAGHATALPPDGLDFDRFMENLAISLIRQALQQEGSIYAAAKLLRLKRTTLTEKIRRYCNVAPDLKRYKGGSFPLRALPGGK